MASKATPDGFRPERRQTLPGNIKIHITPSDDKKKEKEAELLKAQYERLENEKKRIANQKRVDMQRRMSEQAEARQALSQRRMSEKQADRDMTSKSSQSPTESRLFDYRKSQPRSRREIQASDLGIAKSSRSPSPGLSSEDASRMSRRGSLVPTISVPSDVAVKTAGSKTGNPAERRDSTVKTVRSRTGDPAERRDSTARAVRSRTSEIAERRDSVARAARSRTGELDERRGSVSKSVTGKTGGTEEKKVNFDEKRLGADVSDARTRRLRSKSIADPTQVRLPAVHVEDIDDERQKLKQLYNIAIEKVKSVDEAVIAESGFAGGSRARAHSFSGQSFAKGFDNETLKELENILKDARLFSSRRSSHDDHTRPDVSTNRAQKKRIEHLERVLKQLKPEDREFVFEPQKVLQCSYLRLSKSNIQTLEDMIIEKGEDPGIHVHKDVTNYDIWEGLEAERRDSLAVPVKKR